MGNLKYLKCSDGTTDFKAKIKAKTSAAEWGMSFPYFLKHSLACLDSLAEY